MYNRACRIISCGPLLHVRMIRVRNETFALEWPLPRSEVIGLMAIPEHAEKPHSEKGTTLIEYPRFC